MLVHEIVNSCSNDHVAQAALGSIGGGFKAWVEGLAEREGLTAGALAASHVASFGQQAQPQDWKALRRAIRDCDQPVLAGLRHILETGMNPPQHRESASRSAHGCRQELSAAF